MKMAVKPAKNDKKTQEHMSLIAGGGHAPEGSKLSNTGTGVPNFVGVEGVETRGSEGDAKRFAEADKFMKSLKQADKLDPVKVAEVKQEKRDKDAESQPTAAGTNVAALETGKGQSPKETEKVEKESIAAAKGEDPKKGK